MAPPGASRDFTESGTELTCVPISTGAGWGGSPRDGRNYKLCAGRRQRREERQGRTALHDQHRRVVSLPPGTAAARSSNVCRGFHRPDAGPRPPSPITRIAGARPSPQPRSTPPVPRSDRRWGGGGGSGGGGRVGLQEQHGRRGRSLIGALPAPATPGNTPSKKTRLPNRLPNLPVLRTSQTRWGEWPPALMTTSAAGRGPDGTSPVAHRHELVPPPLTDQRPVELGEPPGPAASRPRPGARQPGSGPSPHEHGASGPRPLADVPPLMATTPRSPWPDLEHS